MITLDEAVKNYIESAELREWTAGNCDMDEVDDAYYAKACLESAAEFRQIAEWLTDYKRMKAIENPEEIGLLKLRVQNWIDGLEISKSVMLTHDCSTDDLDSQIELLKTVVAVLERIEI